jgi:DNA-binding CsgD family transcriptional regulator
MEAFDSTVGLIYESAFDERLWPDVLPAMIRLVGADGGQIIVAREDYSQVVRSDVAGFPAEANDEYVAFYHTVDPRPNLILKLPPGVIAQDHLCFDESFIARSEYYQDFLRRYDCRYVTGCRLKASEDMTIIYAMLTRPASGPLSTQGVELLRRLHAHLQRAASLHVRVLAQASECQRLAALLDQLRDAVFIVSHDGRLKHANQPAQELARRADGLVVRNGLLTAHVVSEARQLQSLLAGSTCTRKSTHERPFKPFLKVSRRPPAMPLHVVVIPLSGSSDCPDAGDHHVVVWVSDPARPARMDPLALLAWYGLTPAEARVASMLVDGMTPADIAQTLEVSMPTVRTQLASAFAKTGTTRQTELLELLARSAPRFSWH